MMYPRLQLLKQLLRDDGVILISIDDHELCSLGLLMSEIFGPENWAGTIIWKGSTENNPTLVAMEHEYILCWAKSKASLPHEWTDPMPPAKQLMLDAYESIKLETSAPAEIQRRFRFFIKENRAACAPLTHYDRVDATGPFTGSRKVHKPEKDGYFYDILHPKTGKPCKVPVRGYRYPPATMRKLLAGDRIIYGEDESQIIQIKEYLTDYAGKLKSVINMDSRVGANALEAIFGNRETFRGPKPVALLKYLFGFMTSGDDIVLDSFAGSGTTAHAVLEANQEDGCNRRFILVQMPYDTKKNETDGLNICRDITAERVRRVIAGYERTMKRQEKERIEGLGGSFTYAKLGDPVFGEYRDMGAKQPAYSELAKYIFYTETSRDFDARAVDAKTGKIGERSGTSYYLLYAPNGTEGWPLDLAWLRSIDRAEKSHRLVVYCDKLWVHRDDLAAYEAETGRKVRPMLIPFNLK